VRIRSYEQLDFSLAWRRVLDWAKGGNIDVPDRLPFEVLSRLYGEEGQRPERDHHLAPVTLVMSSKKSGTSRPFSRINPLDLTLYQALVDGLAPDVEAALASRTKVFAYRQTLDRDTHAFSGTPSRAAFEAGVQGIFASPFSPNRYAIKADIAGYFLHVSIDELEHRLYAVSSQVDIVRDLLDLLRAWQTLGIRGLPQGVRPSAPLGNLYLAPVDELLIGLRVPFVRWMDDWVIGARGFHAARETQDHVERCLYNIGLTLAADKTTIVRAARAREESETAKDRLARLKRARRDAAMNDLLATAELGMDYPPDEADLPDPGELDQEATVAAYEELLHRLESPDLSPGFRPMVTEILRDLGSVELPHALDRLPRLLERAPDLTSAATRYLAEVARATPEEVRDIFSELLAAERFTREYEKLALCQGVLVLRLREAPELAGPMARWALEDAHALVRARAVLAWGAQSAADDFEVADRFWAGASPPWRPYALVAIQSKSVAPRNQRFDRWSGEGRFLGRLGEALKSSPISWRKL
jgi:hypothetical protein